MHRERKPFLHRQSLLKLVKDFKCETVAEVGVYRAETAELVLRDSGSQIHKYYLIDPWKTYGDPKAKLASELDAGCPYGEMWEAAFERARRLTLTYSSVEILRKTSAEAAELLKGEEIDLVFIDGDHSYEAVRRDILAWAPLARKVLAGHDYYSRWPGVVRAVNELLSCESLQFLPDTVWYVLK